MRIPTHHSLNRQNQVQRKYYSHYLANRRGVFDRDGSQTLYLFVDVKTDGQSTWPAVVQALQPLREKGWLTKVNGSSIIKGPITVVGTGYLIFTSSEYQGIHH